jgi:mono/diheme cytochrome c family protein
MRRRLWTAAVGMLTVATLACGGGGDADGDAAPVDTAGATTPPPATPPATGAATLPEGVTQEMVTAGQAIFTGAGICYTCHAQDGSGVENLGANLTDQEWLHSDGSYEAIVQTITTGVPTPLQAAAPMPPMGGAALSEQQVREVGAYVYSLSHGG